MCGVYCDIRKDAVKGHKHKLLRVPVDLVTRRGAQRVASAGVLRTLFASDVTEPREPFAVRRYIWTTAALLIHPGRELHFSANLAEIPIQTWTVRREWYQVSQSCTLRRRPDSIFTAIRDALN